MLELQVIATFTELAPRAREQAKALGLAYKGVKQARDWREPTLFLQLDEKGWALQESGRKAPGPTRVDFVTGAAAHRRLYGGGKGQAVAKAVGLGNIKNLNILDATAGLGRDAFVLATLGCQMTLVERSPLVHCLLSDGLERAQGNGEIGDLIDAMKLLPLQSSATYLETLDEHSFDVVFLDPMFPHREKSAKVKKEMMLFQEIVGADLDADTLLAPALHAAKYRVVVKRPKGAPCLADTKPTYCLEGKSGRFDIYVNKGMV